MAIGLRVGLAAALSAAGLACGVGNDELGGSKTLIVLAGQSTALSYGTTSTLTDSSLAAPYAPVAEFSHQALLNDDPVSGWTDYTGVMRSLNFDGLDRVGLEVTLLRDLDRASPGVFAIARVAIGGSTAAQWDPVGSYPTGPTNLFQQLVAYVLAAKASAGATRVVFCWEHGASEAKTLGSANAYQAWLTTFVTALRAALGADMPFVLGKMNVNNSIVTFPNRTELRASQVAFAAATPTTWIVDEDSVSITGSGGHYNGNEITTVGHLYAPAVAASLGLRVPPNPSFTYAPTNLSVAFTDTSTSPGSTVTSWLWAFGDGATSTLQNPTHVYAVAGTYGVTLKATNAAGDAYVSAPLSIVVSSLAVSRDAGSNIFVPNDATEFGSLLTSLGNPMATPNSLYRSQEDGTAGQTSLADSIGAVTATWNGTAGAYGVTVSPWVRKGVAAAASTTTKFAAAGGAGPNPTTTSSLWLWYVDVTAIPTAVRQLIACGGGSASFDGSLAINTSGAVRIRCVGVSVDGVVDVVSGGVRPFWLQYDRTHGVIRGGTDLELVTGTYNAGVVDSFKGLFAGGGGTSVAASAVWGCRWDGAAAEVAIGNFKTVLGGLGFSVLW